MNSSNVSTGSIDLKYMDDAKLLEEFDILKKDINKICVPLGELLRQYTFRRQEFEAFVEEFKTRDLQIKLD